MNVGLDAQTQRALGDEDTSFADDCRQRLESSFTSSVGTPPPADCWSQLRTSIEAVFRSAQSARASAYRRREGLAEDPLTAVALGTGRTLDELRLLKDVTIRS